MTPIMGLTVRRSADGFRRGFVKHRIANPDPESRPLPGSLLTSGLLPLPIQLDDVDSLRLFTTQPPAEVIGPQPAQIILLRLLASPQARHDEGVEWFCRFAWSGG